MTDGRPARHFHLARRCLEHEAVRLAILLILAAFLADWATKSWALARVAESAMPLGGLTLSVVRNEGFAFSVGAERIAFGLVLMARIAALGAIVLLCRHIVYLLDYRNACGFALLFAGGLGNAADLLFRGGAVVDFIGAGPFPLGWSEEPAYLQLFFNTADLFILVGIGLLRPLISETGKSVERRCAGWLQGRAWGRGTG